MCLGRMSWSKNFVLRMSTWMVGSLEQTFHTLLWHNFLQLSDAGALVSNPDVYFFCGGLIKTQQIHNGFCFEFRQVQGMVLSSSCPLAVPVIFHYIHKSYSFKQQSFTFLCKKGVLKSAKCLTSCCNVNRGSLHRIFQIAASSRTSPAL